MTHYFNSFRRKPAISKFDWLFTPNHRSSEIFATITGSFLRPLLNGFQTAPMARSLGFGLYLTNALLKLVFTTPTSINLSLPNIYLANPLYKRYNEFRLLVRWQISGSISLLSLSTFLHSTNSLSVCYNI